jgi:hypothetical protein
VERHHHVGWLVNILEGNAYLMTELPQDAHPARGRRSVAGTRLFGGRRDEANLHAVSNPVETP